MCNLFLSKQNINSKIKENLKNLILKNSPDKLLGACQIPDCHSTHWTAPAGCLSPHTNWARGQISSFKLVEPQKAS